MGRAMSQKDFYDIIGIKSNLSPNTIKKVWKNIQELIISELQNNDSIVFENFGKFKVVQKGGKDEWFENALGLQEKKYVEPFDFVEFEPSKNFVNTINSASLERITRAKFDKNETTDYQDILSDLDVDKSVNEIVRSLLDKKNKKNVKAKQRNEIYKNGETLGYANVYKGKEVKCINNGVIYKSTYQISKMLKIRIEKLYQNFNKGIMEVDGYIFEFVDEPLKGKKVKDGEE